MTFEQFTSLTWIWIGIAVVVFFLLLFINAPYGKFTKTTWGPLIDNKLGWFLMEVVVIGAVLFFVLTGHNHQTIAGIVMLLLFGLHYFHRTFIYPLRIKTKGKKTPLVIILMGIAFNLINGLLIGYYFGNFNEYPKSWLICPQFIIGVIIFFTGMIINWQSDTILINLRKHGETGYKIPYGGMFKYVSSPNLLGEITEWAGFMVMTWSLPGLAFFVWTFANLIPRALANHKWYLATFADYPKDRKAIILFLW
jgi:3-oxo-5-alpha-steroid 4-dehydrogenase 1